MKVTINVSRKEIEHLRDRDSEFDACGVVEDIVKRVKKECL